MTTAWKMLVGALVVMLVVVAGVAAVLSYKVGQERKAKRAAQNALARADTTRVVLEDSVARVFERLSEVRDGNVELTGRLRDIAAENRERGNALLRLRVLVDSLTDIITTGTVVAVDSTDEVRRLTAALDTNGVEVGIEADVPRPPASAAVRWSFAMEPLNVLASITQTPDGAAVFRAEVNRRARVIADSLVVRDIKLNPSLFSLKLPWWTNVLSAAGGVLLCVSIC